MVFFLKEPNSCCWNLIASTSDPIGFKLLNSSVACSISCTTLSCLFLKACSLSKIFSRSVCLFDARSSKVESSKRWPNSSISVTSSPALAIFLINLSTSSNWPVTVLISRPGGFNESNSASKSFKFLPRALTLSAYCANAVEAETSEAKSPAVCLNPTNGPLNFLASSRNALILSSSLGSRAAPPTESCEASLSSQRCNECSESLRLSEKSDNFLEMSSNHCVFSIKSLFNLSHRVLMVDSSCFTSSLSTSQEERNVSPKFLTFSNSPECFHTSFLKADNSLSCLSTSLLVKLFGRISSNLFSA
ncbi:hypothetical protein AGLY_004550 [Aphis glycines]|uniref:Uncharacterized protein n=1 Tax=Aphis glycines TaxID=307491 RepID=A0A6G0TYJ0_APHGL|nr:hypothetical protein AGLY_004550 [Aphis glycines]